MKRKLDYLRPETEGLEMEVQQLLAASSTGNVGDYGNGDDYSYIPNVTEQEVNNA